MLRVRTSAWVLVAALAASRATLAQGVAQGDVTERANDARAHFERGLTLLHAGNFDGALAEFQRSYELSPRPSVLYNIAVAQQSLNRYPAAARSLEQYLRDVRELPPTRRAEVERVLAELNSLVAHVQVTVDRAGATVQVDGERVGTSPLVEPVAVGPGHHVLDALIDGIVVDHTELTIASGESRDVHFTASPPPPIASTAPTTEGGPSPTRTAVLVLRSTPPDAHLVLDGSVVPAGIAVHLAPGEHALVATAPGRATWRGSIGVGVGEARVVAVHLAPGGGLAPAPFALALTATCVLGAAAAITGVLTLNTKAAFDTVDPSSPQLDVLAARGTALRDASDVLWAATAVAAVASVVLLTQTRLSPARSNIDVAFVPGARGASGALRVAF